ncbi:MAG: ABC-F family ATP-binding cassette domain-containing protein [Treponema sp.]
MPNVQLSKITLAFADRDILKDITLVLSKGTKAALTGANGCGKSTLMKIIAGVMQADSGSISIEKNTRVAYLPQSGIVHAGNTLLKEAETAFAHSHALLAQLESLGQQMAQTPDTQKAERLAHEYHAVQTELEQSQWYARKGLIDETLRGLGFVPTDFERLTNEFSGGWQMRIALAKILLSGAHILILDEPTNYLDIEARTWLTAWLKNFSGGFLLVSHDRSFLDESVREIYELFNGSLKRYTGTYTHYEQVRQEELASLVKAYTLQQEEIAKTEDFIRKFRYNASKAALVQDRIRRLEKLEPISLPEHLKKIHFAFPPAPHSGNIVLTAEQIDKCYGDRTVLQNAELMVAKKERVVLVGRNGAGKTTFLRILAGKDTAYTGTVRYGAGVLIGYFSQDEAEQLNSPESIITVLEKEAPLPLIPKLYDMLAAFLFRGNDIHKPLAVLSGGEKARFALLRLLLKPINLLILDEPTNHLDLHSKDVLLDALQHFDGTVLFVSHDKFFIQKLATRVLELTAATPAMKAPRIRNFPGTYDYYLYRIAQEDITGTTPAHQASSQKLSVAQGQAAPTPLAKKTTDAESYELQKKQRSEKRKRDKEEERIMTALTETEEKIQALETLLTQPEIYKDGEKIKSIQTEIATLHETSAQLTKDWEALTL